ncbi:MAG: pectin acetylesterase-family hydrolase [Polyangia bacterium]
MKYALPLLLFCFAVGCSDEPGNDHDLGMDLAGIDDMSGTPPADLISATDAAAEPIVAPESKWTWIPVEGAVCSDGSQTGIGVNPGPDPSKMIIYLDGGGACGSYQTCFQAHTASLGPYGQAEFDERAANFEKPFVRTSPNNAFADYTLVFIPYCTADLHAGIRTLTYEAGGMSAVFHHNGHINVLRDMDRIAATWPSVQKLVFAGASGGGYGALINYGDARERWPDATSYLIDDSGPPLENDYASPLLSAWIVQWGVLDWAKGLCPECEADVSKLIPNIAHRYPSDRMSLLESEADQVISGFYLLDATDFATAITELATDRIVPQPNFKSFYIEGNTHTMLGNLDAHMVGGVTANTFIQQQLNDDPAWKSLAP